MVEINGDFYDEETGEYLGPTNATGYPEAVTDEASLLFVMRKLMEAESEVQAEKAKLDAVIENVKKMVAVKESKAKWIRNRYDSSLKFYAYDQLPRDKEGNLKRKRLDTPWGSISFRSIARKLQIANMDVVTGWAERNCPEMLKVTKTVLISKLPDDLADQLIADPKLAEVCGLEVIDGEEAGKITTNL